MTSSPECEHDVVPDRADGAEQVDIQLIKQEVISVNRHVVLILAPIGLTLKPVKISVR